MRNITTVAVAYAGLMRYLRSVRVLKPVCRISVFAAGGLLALGIPAAGAQSAQDVQAVYLRTENRVEPLGLDPAGVRLSWRTEAGSKDFRQSAYRIVVARSAADLQQGKYLWDSGKVESAESSAIAYGGTALEPQQIYYWQVRLWDAAGQETQWSRPAFWETGLNADHHWRAKWIGGEVRDTKQSVPAVYYRTTFNIADGTAAGDAIVSARLYVTARGLFEGWINGKRVGEDYFVPGWTDFNMRNQYLTYDVTEMLKRGENALGFIVGDGWHNGYLMWDSEKNWYGEDTALLAKLVIRYADGRTEVVGTSDAWLNRTGPILFSDIYDGETYDARLELGAWNQPGYAAEGWQQSRELDFPAVQMDAKVSEPVRKQETVQPVSIKQAADGEWIYDFGQNLVGWVKIKTKGAEGETVVLRFAEMLNPDGTLYVKNLRKAKATDTYVFGKETEAEWEPRFTFHGFRYAGVKAKTPPESIEAIVLHSELPVAGSFETSNTLVNRLQQNIVWGLKGNFLEVPTDCPQRNERLAWTGDAQVFIRTAIYNRDVLPFFEKWLADLRDGQKEDGQFPNYAPALRWQWESSSAWGDAGVICPWALYEFYGDKKVLEDNYAAMKAWMDYQERSSKNLIRQRSIFGDWLALDRPNARGGRDTDTPRELVSTAYFAHTSELMSKIAAALDKDDDARYYADSFKRIRGAFQKTFIAADGRIKGNTQTVYLLALGFDLLPENLRETAVNYLVEDIRNRDWHLSTGFVGTALLLPVLSDVGRDDVAYRLLLQETYPSWLYSVLQGATTIWERWNSYSHETGFGPVGMNSFNHYAYGALGQWLYGTVGGISPLEPGFKKILIRPVPGGNLTWAKTHYDCPYGRIATDWRIDGETFTLKVTVPPNTGALVVLPDGTRHTVGSGAYIYSCTLPRGGEG